MTAKSATTKRWRKEYPERYAEQRRRHRRQSKTYRITHREHRQRREARRALIHRTFVNWLKEQPCSDCHVVYPPYVMDFDHRDRSTKLFEIGPRIGRVSTTKLLAELVKCDLVCANCHRIRTHG